MMSMVCSVVSDRVLLQQVAQGDARQVLHHQVGRVGVLALVEDVDDVRMGEAGGRAGLLDEALP